MEVKHCKSCNMMIAGLVIVTMIMLPSVANAQYYIKRFEDRSQQTQDNAPATRPSVPTYQYQLQQRRQPAIKPQPAPSQAITPVAPTTSLKQAPKERPGCTPENLRVAKRFNETINQYNAVSLKGASTREDRRIVKDFDKLMELMEDEAKKDNLLDIVHDCMIFM